MRRAILTFLILAAAAVQAQDPFAYKIYKVTGPPGATEVYPSNMAEDGRIVGSARVNGVYGAFSGKLEDGYKVLPKLPWGAEASCYGGSADGRLAGASYSQAGKREAIYWDSADRIFEIGIPSGRDHAEARGANSSGQFLVNSSNTSQENERPYVWTEAGGFSLRDVLPGMQWSLASTILQDGSIVGACALRHGSSNVEYRATLWLPSGVAVQLAHPNGARDASANYAKDRSLILGAANVNGTDKPTVWENGVPRLLPDFGGYGYVRGIAANGDLYGICSDTAVKWVGGTTLVNLNTMIDPSTPGWLLQYAGPVAPDGKILGLGVYNGVDSTSFIAVPVYGQDVFAESATVNLGWLEQGDFFSLTEVDDDVFRVCKFLVPNQQVAPVQVTVSGHTPYPTLGSLVLQVASRATQVGLYSQKLELFDFSTGAYDPVDTRTDPLGTTGTQRGLAATGSVGRYRRSDGLLRARYSVRAVGPTVTVGWCAEHDMVKWQVKP